MISTPHRAPGDSSEHRAPGGSALLLLAACLIGSGPVLAAFEPQVRPVLEIRPSPGPIVVDGILDDAGWAGAAHAIQWSEIWPGDNVQPPVGHEAWVTYDDENLYFAILVEDDPAALRVSFRDRDRIFADDYVGLILDTYGSGAWAYEFFFNPRGIQGDLRWTPDGEDVGFDVIHHSQGRITQTGWQVEVAIPFRSLRFPDRDDQVWRATFWHSRPRESRERFSWAAGDRDDPCWPCTWGTILGIRGVDGGGALEILPSVTTFDAQTLRDDSDPDSGFDHDRQADIGVGARYALSSSFSAEATFNPDFSQVESDAGQIEANTTFALFFPEQRPFFQEGSDLYSSYVRAIYTRSVNDPRWAGKLTGRNERWSAAILAAQDEHSPLIIPFEERSAIFSLGRSWSTIGRVRRALHDDSYLGALATYRHLEGGGNNAVGGFDTLFRLGGPYQFEGQWLFSHTEEADLPTLASDVLDGSFDDGRHTELLDGEVFGGHAGYLSLERHGRHWSWDADYWRTSRTFRADNGFITQNDRQQAILWTDYAIQPDGRWIDDARAFLMFGRVWNIGGRRKDEWIRPELTVSFKSQTSIQWGYLTSNERFRGQDLDGIQRWDVGIETRFSEILSGGIEYEQGDLVARRATPARLGNGQRLELGLDIKPRERLVIEPSFEWQRLEDPASGDVSGDGFFEGYLLRARTSLQFTRRLFLRLVLQYDDLRRQLDVEPLLTYRIDPFTVIYAGSSHRFEDYGDRRDGFGLEDVERQFFAKLQWFFRS